MHPLPPGSRLLFLGDSITDCGRDRAKDGSPNPADLGLGLGSGYALLLAARFLAAQAGDGLDIRNLGISGNRVVDIAARAQEHIWNLRPTHLSILVGVNDTWHHFMRGAVGEDVVAGVHGEMSGLTASKTEADGSVSGERRRRCAPTTTVSPSSVATGWLPAAERLRTR